MELRHHMGQHQNIRRYILLCGTASLLLALGFYESSLNQNLKLLYQTLFDAIHFGHIFRECASCGELTRFGSVLITFSYGVLYSTISILVIYAYLPKFKIIIFSFFIYLSLFIVSIAVNEAGKAFGFAPFRVTAYRIMALVLSPAPVVLLIPSLFLLRRRQVN